MALFADAIATAGSDGPFSLSTILIGTSVVVGIALVANLVFVLRTNRRVNYTVSRHWVSKVLHLAFLCVIAVLALSSFGTLVTTGHLLGYPLLLHLTAAGAFVFLLLAFAAFYLPQGSIEDAIATSASRWWLNRWSVWALVLASLVTAGSMFLSMLPVLDTEGLLQAALLHRYAGLVVVVASVVHAYTLVCVRFRWR